jgi:hypothetical protein
MGGEGRVEQGTLQEISLNCVSAPAIALAACKFGVHMRRLEPLRFKQLEMTACFELPKHRKLYPNHIAFAIERPSGCCPNLGQHIQVRFEDGMIGLNPSQDFYPLCTSL